MSSDAPPGPRWLYLHGFASGPGSHKGVALARHFGARGVTLERLDLRRPSLEHLRLSAILDEVARAVGGPSDRAVVFGSSLGGLAAARAAERDPRICALVLLAPGFRIAEQFARSVGPVQLETWRREGALRTLDYATGKEVAIDYGFYEDAAEVDAANGGWPDVRVPTLIVHGTRDTTCELAVSRTWARGRRHVRLVEVDDGHELTASIPLIAREAERFLEPFLNP